MTLLVVDDDPLNRKLARTILLGAGYSVILAEDALSAITQLERTSPRLLILDLMLPEIDGFELTSMLRSDPRYHDLPILAMTASNQRCDHDRALQAGCDRVMEKPFNCDELLAAVADLLPG